MEAVCGGRSSLGAGTCIGTRAGKGRSALESLPSEILFLICDLFSHEPHEPGEVVSAEFFQKRETLRQLSLTSRTLLLAATPFLYGVIILHGPRKTAAPRSGDDASSSSSSHKLPQLALLLRTLLENPRLRPAVRHLACLVNLKGSRISHAELERVRQVWNTACQRVRVSESDARILRLAELPTTPVLVSDHGARGPDDDPSIRSNNGSRRNSSSSRNSDDAGDNDDCLTAETAPIPEDSSLKGLGERIFAAMLCLTSNLDSVVLQMPRCARAPPDVDNIRCAITSRIIDSALQDSVVGSTVLQKLTTVKVQPNMESFMYSGWEEHDDEDDDSESCCGVRLDACPGLFNAPQITTVEGFKDSGGWDALPAGTRDVRVRGLLEPSTVSTVCDYPGLERLTICPAAMDMPRADPDRDEFNTALRKRTDTLKHLCLQTMGNETLLPSFGPKARLQCLPELTRLETLSVELLGLFGSSDQLATLQLQDLLPRRSLRMLTLVEQWTYGDPVLSPVSPPPVPSLGKRYQRELYGMLAAFARSCADGRLPQLRRFDYIRNPYFAELHGSLSSASSKDSGGWPDFERLRKLFEEAGVRLELEMMEW